MICYSFSNCLQSTNYFLTVFGKQLKMPGTKQKEIAFSFEPRDKLQLPQQQPQQQQQQNDIVLLKRFKVIVVTPFLK